MRKGELTLLKRFQGDAREKSTGWSAVLDWAAFSGLRQVDWIEAFTTERVAGEFDCGEAGGCSDGYYLGPLFSRWKKAPDSACLLMNMCPVY